MLRKGDSVHRGVSSDQEDKQNGQGSTSFDSGATGIDATPPITTRFFLRGNDIRCMLFGPEESVMELHLFQPSISSVDGTDAGAEAK